MSPFPLARAVSCAIVLFLVVSVGCSAPSRKPDAEPVPTRATGGEEVLHEWSEVYSVRTTATGNERTHVGFLDRQFTLSDRDGTTYVLDRLHVMRGFILASGSTFVVSRRGYGADETQNLGKIGLERGIRRILDVADGIEIEPISAR